MRDTRLSPEELILSFSEAQLQQLLKELGLESSPSNAQKLQRMVRALGDLERALESIAGPASMRRAG